MDRVAGAGPDRVVAGVPPEHRLIAGGRVDKEIGAAAAEDRLAGHAGDRLVAAAAAPDRVGCGAPDRLVTGGAAGNRLMAEMPVDELVWAAAALDRVADPTADRFRAVAEQNEVAGTVIHHAVIAVQQCQRVAVRGADREPLITRRRRVAAVAGGVDDEFEIEITGNRRRWIVGISRCCDIDRLAGREENVLRARWRACGHQGGASRILLRRPADAAVILGIELKCHRAVIAEHCQPICRDVEAGVRVVVRIAEVSDIDRLA